MKLMKKSKTEKFLKDTNRKDNEKQFHFFFV
jgi:hypothetical protein